MIWVAKGAAARALMNHTRVGPALCWAYADHANGLDLLNAVGHPLRSAELVHETATTRGEGCPLARRTAGRSTDQR
jgi:hypothetical protein